MAKVSLIIPVYNAAAYLERCVECVRAQTFADFELILIDDGSTDGSSVLCDQLAGEDARIRVIHQRNGGAAAARNAGLDVACGEYIVFMDSDDCVSPQYIERLAETVQRHADCYGVTGFTHTMTELGQIANTGMAPGRAYRLPEEFRDIYGAKLLGCVWGGIFERQKIERLGLRFRSRANGDYNEDLLFCLTYVQHCSAVCYTGHADYGYLLRDGSLSRGAYADNYWEKYAEKFVLWAQMIERYGAHDLLGELAEDTLYHLLAYIDQLAQRGMWPGKAYFACFEQEGYRQMMAHVQGKREGKRVMYLLKGGHMLLLWGYLQLHKIQNRIKH